MTVLSRLELALNARPGWGQYGPLPLLLAGGLTPDNLPATLAALAGATPAPGGVSLCVWGVDCSSGVEAGVKGAKDAGKVVAWLAARG